jgi:hypothetical protein
MKPKVPVRKKLDGIEFDHGSPINGTRIYMDEASTFSARAWSEIAETKWIYNWIAIHGKTQSARMREKPKRG